MPTVNWTLEDGHGNVLQSGTVTVSQDSANQASLLTKAQNALTNNQTYLAIPSPTQAQAVSQVGALTRQMDAVIRFLLTAFSTISDT